MARIGTELAALVLSSVCLSATAGCGKRHVIVHVEVVAHIRVVDAGGGIEGAEVLVGGFYVDDPGWRAEQIAEHQEDPEFRILGLSGYGVTGPDGLATIHYQPHRSWMEVGFERGSPGECLLTRVWVSRRGYEPRVLRVDLKDRAVLGDSGWTLEVRLPDVILSSTED